MTRPITYFSIYRSNGQEWRAKVLRDSKYLVFLALGLGRQALNSGKRGPLLEE